MVSALFVQKNGCYFGLKDVDPWDEDRDARNYNGHNPVVAPPPCQLLGQLAFVNYKRWGGEHNKPYNDEGMFNFALTAVRHNGGVIEHPAKSHAFKIYGLGKPQKGRWIRSDDCGGWICEVWQSAYGHKANKATWLYYCGWREPFDLNWDRPKGTHQIGFQDQRGKSKNKPTLNKKEANATPENFRDELIRLAKHGAFLPF